MIEFGGKIFNEEAFGRYLDTLPRLERNELLRSGAIYQDRTLYSMMKSQTAGHRVTKPIFGLIGGEPQNYDGQTDVETNTTPTAQQTAIVIGRMNGWSEQDFAYDISGGTDFMGNVASQVNAYWDERDQKTIIKVLDGIFSMTGAKNKPFIEDHTYVEDGPIGPTTLNNARQQAMGDNKDAMSLIIMHSRVATSLENQNLLEFVKYTDSDGIERNMNIARYNGHTVLVDDSMPVKDGKYTSYLLGRGVLGYTPVDVMKPNEVVRDAKTRGGMTELITRRRRIISPYGISFNGDASILSPTDDQLADGKNWDLVIDTEGNTINHRAIPMGRIITNEDGDTSAGTDLGK